MKKAAVIGGTNCLCGKFTLTPLDENYDILIVNYLTCGMLARTALGMESEITDALIKNKPVYVINSGMTYKELSNNALFELYGSYRNRLMSYGVKFINCTDEIFNGKNHGKLLNYAEISDLSDKVITIGRDTLITPSAQDFAREHNITIIRDDCK